MTLRDQRVLWAQAVRAWRDDYAPSMGAALAYYTLFSLSPLLLIVMAVAGFAFPEQVARGEVAAQLRGLMGESGAQAVQALLEAGREPGKGLVATLVGAAMVVVGATSVFGELQTSLDRIWRVPHRTRARGMRRLLNSRLQSFAMVVGTGALVLVWLGTGAALAAFGQRPGAEPLADAAAQALELVIGFVLVSVLFAMIYKFIPRARIAWRDVWIGALVTAALFTVGKFLIALYLGTSGLSTAFGAAGSLAALMVWLNYSAQIFLLGAEFTWVYAHRFGSRSDRSAAAAKARWRASRNT